MLRETKANLNPDWTALSPEGLWRVQRLAFPLMLGYSHAEVGASVDATSGWVSEQLAELRDELQRVAQ